jgi:hypothetical protein
MTSTWDIMPRYSAIAAPETAPSIPGKGKGCKSIEAETTGLLRTAGLYAANGLFDAVN